MALCSYHTGVHTRAEIRYDDTVIHHQHTRYVMYMSISPGCRAHSRRQSSHALFAIVTHLDIDWRIIHK